ncbi:MAG: AAA family ATPase [Thaumarchaeota archaeon]|nr:AAA family ATPase [Nitrososphaerota archaeon]
MRELYKKFRPKKLGMIMGNKSTKDALKNMIAKDTVPQTILFFGPSGCGKTTLARILKNELGCNDLDYREMNCSSERGIDSIREIQRTIGLAPTGKCRIWVLDECHKLTGDAQSAALKILEDTPKNVYFMLCTTHPEKLSKAIRTRCCEMPVQLLNDKQALKLIEFICKKIELELDEDIIEDLIENSLGSARSLLVGLDKLRNLDVEGQRDALKLKQQEGTEGIELCKALINTASWSKVTSILKGITVDAESLRWAVIGYARTVLLGGGKNVSQAALIIECFSDNFFDTKNAGLALACYEATRTD